MIEKIDTVTLLLSTNTVQTQTVMCQTVPFVLFFCCSSIGMIDELHAWSRSEMFLIQEGPDQTIHVRRDHDHKCA